MSISSNRDQRAGVDELLVAGLVLGDQGAGCRAITPMAHSVRQRRREQGRAAVAWRPGRWARLTYGWKVRTDDAGWLLADGQADRRRQYRQLLTQLHEEIGSRESQRQPERADRARAERDWLTSELAAAAGLGGRTRQFTDGRERARIAVSKAIRRTLQHIAEADAMIGEHLRRTVRTGARCSYWPG